MIQSGTSATKSLLLATALAVTLPSSIVQAQPVPPPTTNAAANSGVTPPPDGRPVSLQEAIQIAFQNHANIAVAEESVEAARQRVRQVRTGTLPQIIGEVGYRGTGTSSFFGAFGGEPTRSIPGANPGDPPRRVVVNTDSTTFNQGLQPRVSLNYNVFDGGLTRTRVRQARTGVESNIANLEATRNNQEFNVTANYLTQLRAQALLDLRRVQESLAAEQLRRVEARVRAGDAAEADRALPLSELRNREVDRIFAENDVRVSANALRNSMGLPPGPPLFLVELQERPEVIPSVEGLKELARRQRPEVIQAEAQVRISQADVSIARIARKPRLDTTFSFNLNPNDPNQRSNFAVGAAVSMPLFDFGLTHAQEQEARTGVQANSAQLEQIKKDVAADVVEAYLNLVNARQRLDAGRTAVAAAQVNLEATTARYERGSPGITVVDLIQAQVQFANANNATINALYDIFLAQAQLDRAVGR